MLGPQAAGDRYRRCRGPRAAAPRRDRLRGASSPKATPDFAWPAPGRRVAGDRAQLHLGHHRQPQGRRLPPSRRLPERGRQHARLGHGPASGLSLDAADVPLQRLVLPLDHGRPGRAPMSACGGSSRTRSSTPSASTGSPISAARRSSSTCSSTRPTALKEGIDHTVKADDRRRGAAGRGDRGHGADGLRGHPCLRADRDLWPAAVCAWHEEWNGSSLEESARAQGAPGRALSHARRPDGGRSRDAGAGAARRRDHGRDHDARQRGDEGLPQEPERHATRPSPAAGSTPATSPSGIPTAMSRSRTARRTSSSPAARTSPRSRSRRCSTGIRPCWRPRWSPGPTSKWGETPCAFVTLKDGAVATEDEIIELLPRAAWRGSRCRARWCSASCRRPRPARSRSSCSGTRPSALGSLS